MSGRLCEGCGLKPESYNARRWCYDCKPGWGGRPLPCRRCGSTEDFWARNLCRRCHLQAPQRPEGCRDCHAWGVVRTRKWLCGGCISWRSIYRHPAPCISCHRLLVVNEHGCCRLCWRQVKLVQERLRDRRRGPLDVLGANRHGQQLFLANLSSPKNGFRPRPPRPQPPAVPPATRPRRRARRKTQLELFTRDPIADAADRYGFPDPPNIALVHRLDDLTRDHATRHGWNPTKTHRIRTAMRVLLAMLATTTGPIAASDVLRLRDVDLPVSPVLTILREAHILHEDRASTIELWFATRITNLPPTMASELQTWFDVLHHGHTTPPRTRPRSPVTIKNRLHWTLPTLTTWAAAGHESLRDISREDILAVLPISGTERAKLGDGLQSIFRTLKAHHVVFHNPMARMSTGNFERRTPLPADPDKLRAALNSDDPAGAALAALAVFHGLRPAELRDLRLTDIRDGHLHLSDRTIPLADLAKDQLRAYLDHRYRHWPNSINPHLFIHYRCAGTLAPVRCQWVNDKLGMSAMAIRQDRIVDEAHATAGDLRRICDFFGVTMATAEHYATTLNHPGITSDTVSSRTPDPS